MRLPKICRIRTNKSLKVGVKGVKGVRHSQILYKTRVPLGACPSGALKGVKGVKNSVYLSSGVNNRS